MVTKKNLRKHGSKCNWCNNIAIEMGSIPDISNPRIARLYCKKCYHELKGDKKVTYVCVKCNENITDETYLWKQSEIPGCIETTCIECACIDFLKDTYCKDCMQCNGKISRECVDEITPYIKEWIEKDIVRQSKLRMKLLKT